MDRANEAPGQAGGGGPYHVVCIFCLTLTLRILLYIYTSRALESDRACVLWMHVELNHRRSPTIITPPPSTVDEHLQITQAKHHISADIPALAYSRCNSAATSTNVYRSSPNLQRDFAEKKSKSPCLVMLALERHLVQVRKRRCTPPNHDDLQNVPKHTASVPSDCCEVVVHSQDPFSTQRLLRSRCTVEHHNMPVNTARGQTQPEGASISLHPLLPDGLGVENHQPPLFFIQRGPERGRRTLHFHHSIYSLRRAFGWEFWAPQAAMQEYSIRRQRGGARSLGVPASFLTNA